MPEEVQTAPEQGAAESSPASFEIPKAGTDAYAEWRLSSGSNLDGKSAADGEDAGKPKEEASAASKSESPAPEAGSETPQEKEKQQQQKPQRKNADDRINEWTSDIRALGLKPSDLKLSREELLRRLAPEAPQPKAAAATETTEQPPAAPPANLQPPKKPEFKDFNGDYDAFDAAKDKYFEDLADYKAKAAVEAERIAQAQREQQKTFRQKLEEAKQRYGAEADQAIVRTAQLIAGDQKIHPAVKVLLDESPVLADLLYAMGSEKAEFDSFLAEARYQPGLALRRAVLLEKFVEDELAAKNGSGAATKRDAETGQFVAAEKTPAKKTTAAPAPPSEVSGRGSPPVDEQERASKEDDFRTFRAIDNRRALARIRGQ